MLFQTNKKYYIYIGIIIGLLIALIGTSVIAEEENKKKTLSPKDKAIELAKKCVIASQDGHDITTQKFVEILSKRKNVDFFPIGWNVMDMSESIYAVTFTYRTKEQNQFYFFHVIPKDNIVRHINPFNKGGPLEFEKYIQNIMAISTYSDEKVGDNLVKLLSKSEGKKKK